MRSKERSELVRVIDDLLRGSISRPEASEWAAARIDAVTDDAQVHEALELLIMSDALQVDEHDRPSEYMFELDPIRRVRASL